MNQTIASELFNRKEAADYLRVCRTTLDKLMIPRIKIRRSVFYRKHELEQWLTQNTEIKGGEK